MCRFKVASLVLLQCCVLQLIREGVSQKDGNYPFVSVPDEDVVIDSQTTKTFTTRADVIVKNQTARPFEIDLLLASARSYYGGRSGFSGFLSIDVLQIVDSSPGLVTVTYSSTYNYTALEGSIDNDQAIHRVIGNLAAIKIGLEADGNFSSFYEISAEFRSFEFSGDSVCEKIGCPQGIFTVCRETSIGTSATCVSSCKANFCEHNGWCTHHDGNAAPICSCPTSYDTWYIGTHCETIVQLWMFIVFILLVVLCLVAIAVITCCLPVKLKRKKTNIHEESQKNQKPISTVTEPTIQLQPREASLMTAQNDNYSEKSPTPAPRHVSTPISRSVSDQSETLIASSEGGFEPGYGRILTHRFDSTSTTYNTLRRDDNVRNKRSTKARHQKPGTSRDTEGTSSSEDTEEERRSRREDVNNEEDVLQEYATILNKGVGPKVIVV